MKKDKIKENISNALESMKLFRKEILALKVISDFLNESKDCDLQGVKFQFWKFYRSYQLKQFLLLFHVMITNEEKYVTSTKDKLLQMIDRSFLWNLAEKSDDNNKKYFQRFYSILVLDELIKKNCGQVENSKKRFEAINLDIEKNLSEQLGNLRCKKDLELFKNLIYDISKKKSTDIRLDHVVSREHIKLFIENLCEKINVEKTKHEKVKLIDNFIDELLPYCFGSVVSDQENIALSGKGCSVNEIIENSKLLFHHYKECIHMGAKIVILLIDTKKIIFNSKSTDYIIQGDEFLKIELNNSFDNIILGDKSLNWDNTKKKWLKT